METETKCVEQAAARLKAYISGLNEQIVRIVESESDEFLTVAAKLEAFKAILAELKAALTDFHGDF